MFAVAFLGRLRLTQKFLLLGAIAIVMIAIPVWLYLHEANKALSGYLEERAGLPVVGKMLKGIQLTQQHRGLSAIVLNGGNAEDKRTAKQAEVSAAYKEIDEIVASSHSDELRKQWETLTREWESLQQGVAARRLKAPESFAQHSDLIARLMRLTEQAGDVYGLSLDPDRESYYLIQAMYYQLPSLTEELGKLRARGSALLTKQEANAEERLVVSMLVARANDRLAQTLNGFQKSAAGNPDIERELAAQMKAAGDSATGLTRRAVEEIVKPEALSAKGDAFFAAATQTIDGLFKLNEQASSLLAAHMDRQIADFRRTRMVMLLALGVLLVLSAYAGLMVTRSIVMPLQAAVEVAQRVAAGNLVNEFDVGAQNEIGALMRALRDMNDSLRRIVGEVRTSVDTISAATGDIASGNADLSSRLESQASNLEETASSMEELTATVRHNVENAHTANDLVREVSQMAEQGSGVVSQVVSTMGEIDASSRKIVDIIAVIDGIAFQTNILALNAAVEAARAGEQGRGFAVVASEVRTLAQRSAAAAKEIKALITQSVDKVSQGNALATHAGAAMDEILQSVRSVTTLMQEIAQASAEQSSGIEQVNLAVTQMDDVTQHNAALVEQTAAASASLEEQARALVRTMSVFQLDSDRKMLRAA